MENNENKDLSESRDLKTEEEKAQQTARDEKPSLKATLKYAFLQSLPVLAGYLLLGGGFGILLQAKTGYGPVWAACISLAMYSGTMQYVTVDLLAEGASLISAAIMTVAVQARHLVYGVSMLGKYKGAGGYKPYLAFSLTDETYSILCDGILPANVSRHRYYFFLSAFNQVYWVLGCVLGAALGNILPFSSEGIDFSMTALFVVVFINQWTSTKHHASAVIGVLGSLVCLLIFGADNFVIPAMVVIVAALCIAKPKLDPAAARKEDGNE